MGINLIPVSEEKNLCVAPEQSGVVFAKTGYGSPWMLGDLMP